MIIDEISMINAELFEKLDYIAKVVRRKNTPFGGLQLICCGDFFQVINLWTIFIIEKLPPVVNSENVLVNEPLFCFESPIWKESIRVGSKIFNWFIVGSCPINQSFQTSRLDICKSIEWIEIWLLL